MAHREHSSDAGVLAKWDKFKEANNARVKAGAGSVEAAWEFGEQVDEMHRYYSYADLGEEIGLSGAQISLYRKLFKRFGHVRLLLMEAEEQGTYDSSRLAKSETDIEIAMRVVPHCMTCNSYNVKREKMPATEAEKIRAAVKEAQEGRAPTALFISST